jgi:sulfite exporter TauE/SafE
MSDATLLAVFLAGLLGGGHCAAMCGGIVGALASRRSARVPLQLAYNAGRIGTYCVAGSLAGAIGGVVLLRDVLPVQLALYVLANLLLLSVGLYIAGWPTLVRRLEIPGQWIWRRISPLTGRFLPADTLPRALALGSIWGWLPCGLTYSVLAIALVSGSGVRGASLMLAWPWHATKPACRRLAHALGTPLVSATARSPDCGLYRPGVRCHRIGARHLSWRSTAARGAVPVLSDAAPGNRSSCRDADAQPDLPSAVRMVCRRA